MYLKIHDIKLENGDNILSILEKKYTDERKNSDGIQLSDLSLTR